MWGQAPRWGQIPPRQSSRHCETRSAEAIPTRLLLYWIASLGSLPPARNDRILTGGQTLPGGVRHPATGTASALRGQTLFGGTVPCSEQGVRHPATGTASTMRGQTPSCRRDRHPATRTALPCGDRQLLLGTGTLVGDSPLPRGQAPSHEDSPCLRGQAPLVRDRHPATRAVLALWGQTLFGGTVPCSEQGVSPLLTARGQASGHKDRYCPAGTDPSRRGQAPGHGDSLCHAGTDPLPAGTGTRPRGQPLPCGDRPLLAGGTGTRHETISCLPGTDPLLGTDPATAK
jgi:hypothetical protein